jgi:hypothetical protein
MLPGIAAAACAGLQSHRTALLHAALSTPFPLAALSKNPATRAGFTDEHRQFTAILGGARWPVRGTAASLLEVHAPADIVWLTPDAEAPLPPGPLDPRRVYALGGIVDRSVRRGLTAEWAAERRLATARLPVAEWLAAEGITGVTRRPVLNISDVVTALLTAAANGGDWPAALKAMGGRKLKPEVPNKPRRMRPTRLGDSGSGDGGAAETAQQQQQQQQQAGDAG